jgi:hypothetical protein
MSRAAGLFGFAAALLMAATAHAQTVPELIVGVAPATLRTGVPGRLQIQMVATEQLSNAILSAVAPSGLTLSPARLTVGTVRPPSTGPATPIFQPNPPPLGVVPVRNLRATAAEAGDYEVTVTLTFDGGSVSRTLTIQAR